MLILHICSHLNLTILTSPKWGNQKKYFQEVCKLTYFQKIFWVKYKSKSTNSICRIMLIRIFNSFSKIWVTVRHWMGWISKHSNIYHFKSIVTRFKQYVYCMILVWKNLNHFFKRSFEKDDKNNFTAQIHTF